MTPHSHQLLQMLKDKPELVPIFLEEVFLPIANRRRNDYLVILMELQVSEELMDDFLNYHFNTTARLLPSLTAIPNAGEVIRGLKGIKFYRSVFEVLKNEALRRPLHMDQSNWGELLELFDGDVNIEPDFTQRAVKFLVLYDKADPESYHNYLNSLSCGEAGVDLVERTTLELEHFSDGRTNERKDVYLSILQRYLIKNKLISGTL